MRVGQSRKRDTTEGQIVKALRKAGVQVFPISGRGVPDLLLFHRGQWSVMEVKTKGGRLTDAQRNTRVLAPFPVVESIEEAFKVIGLGH